MNANEFIDYYNDHFFDKDGNLKANDIFIRFPEGPELSLKVLPSMTFFQAFKAQADYMHQNPDYRIPQPKEKSVLNAMPERIEVSKDQIEYKNKPYSIVSYDDGTLDVINVKSNKTLNHKSPVTKAIIKFFKSNKSKS